MFLKEFSEAQSNHHPISVYTDGCEPSKFSLGFIQAVSEEYILLQSITPYGLYDGYTLRRCDDIYRVEKDDEYGRRVFKPYTLHNQTHASFPTTADLVQDVLQFALEQHLVVSIELLDSGCDDAQGYVYDVQEEQVSIHQLNDDGRPDGDATLLLQTVTCVTCDSEKEAALRLLAQNV